MFINLFTIELLKAIPFLQELYIVIFETFLYPQFLSNLAKMIISIRLSDSGQKRVSILDLPGHVLIVPQATLGGKVKGKMMQYHSNIAKDEGLELYKELVSQCSRTLEANEKCKEARCKVECGTYGNIQVLSMDTNGPYTHYFDF